jgi:hypothetical protein
MALTSDTKDTVTQICALIAIDPNLNLALRSSAERLLSPTDKAKVWAVLARNANGAVQATQQTALNTLIADIAAN